MQYVSPGDAFSSSLEQSLLVRAQAERQAQMDQLAMQREQRMIRHEDEERQQAKAALEEKRREFNETQTDKQKAAFEKTLGTMVPGDIPSPELLDQAKKFGLGHLFPESEPQIAAAPPPAAPSMMPEPPASIAAEGAPVPMPAPMMPDAGPKPEMAPTRGGMRFVGSPKQREEAKDKETALNIINAMPDGPQKSALQLSVATGKPPSAEMMKNPENNDTPIAKVDRTRNIVQRLVAGKWVDVEGDVPKGTHFIQEPTPPVVKDRTQLSATAETAFIAKLNKQWKDASKPARELERQVSVIGAGMVAARRGDMAQGAQTVLVAFQKILDPPSVVREAEFDRSAAGQSMMNRVRGAYEKLSKGGAGITLPELEKFHTLAKEAAAAQMSHYLTAEKERIGMNADRYTIPRELVFEKTAAEDAPAADSMPASTPKSSKTSAADLISKYGTKKK